MISQINASMPFIMYIDAWLGMKYKEIEDSTYNRYKSRVESYIKSELGDFGIEEIDADVISDFFEDLIRKIPHYPHTIRDVYIIVHNLFQTAVSEGVVTENPCVDITIPKIDRHELVLWDEDEIESYLNGVGEHPFSPAFYLGIREGLTQGEILSLSWRDIDFKTGKLRLGNILSHDGKLIIDRTLENRTRFIQIEKRTVEVLRNHLRSQRVAGVNNPLDLIIPSAAGTTVNPRKLLRFHDIKRKEAPVFKHGEEFGF